MTLSKNLTAFMANRLTGLGGSDIGAILGLSPYRTAVDVWAEKTGRAAPQESTIQMRFGSFAEQFVAEEYTAQTGNVVERYTKMLRHSTAPLIGHVDRLVIPAGRKHASTRGVIKADRLLEAKTASAFAAFNSDEWGEAGTDAVPAAYLVQVATYRILTGCEYADLAVLFGNQELRVYHLNRDRDLEEMIVARASEWWEKHVVADVAPAPSCESDLRILYPRSKPLVAIEADSEAEEAICNLRRVRNQIKELEGYEDQFLLAIKSYMQDAEALTIGDTTLATWKSAAQSNKVDWKAVAEELGADPDVIAKHTTVADGSRRFLLSKEKT